MSSDLPEAEGDGEMVHLKIDGEIQSFELEAGISDEERQEFVNSMLGIDPGSPSEVNHPDLEFADIPDSESPEPEGMRVVCDVDGCNRTVVFETFEGVRDSEWTEANLPIGLLSDMTELHYGFCPDHSLDEEDGYEPENDFASHEFSI